MNILSRSLLTLLAIGLSFSSLSAQQLDIKVQLQGPLQNSSTMTVNDDPEFRAAMNAKAPEELGAAPSDAVDHVTVLLVEGDNIITEIPAWLLSNGHVVNGEGFPLSPEVQKGGNFIVGVVHRNHVPVFASKPVSVEVGTISIDLTNPSALSNESTYVTEEGKAAMAAGNVFDQDPYDMWSVNSVDKSKVMIAERDGITGYVPADLNLDGKVDQQDVLLVKDNAAKLRRTRLQSAQ
jgi:hypothetical protein